MKRILILCGALALPAAVGVSNLHEAEDLGTPLAAVGPQETSAIVRRVYEGPLSRNSGEPAPHPMGAT